MKKEDLIRLIADTKTNESIKSTKFICLSILEKNELLRLEVGGYKFQAEHFYKIYWGRSQNPKLDRSLFLGLEESIENLKTAHGLMQPISFETKDQWGLLLISEPPCEIVGCILKIGNK